MLKASSECDSRLEAYSLAMILTVDNRPIMRKCCCLMDSSDERTSVKRVFNELSINWCNSRYLAG